MVNDETNYIVLWIAVLETNISTVGYKLHVQLWITVIKTFPGPRVILILPNSFTWTVMLRTGTLKGNWAIKNSSECLIVLVNEIFSAG